jgi:hypothetical protein
MHPQLRSCYDALLRDADSPALFPHGENTHAARL